MASNDFLEPTIREQSQLRLRAIVDAQMWAQVEHVYVAPELAVLSGGTGMVVLDADGLIVGMSPDLAALGVEPSKDSVSYELAHPAPAPEPLPLPEPEVPLTEEEVLQAEKDMEEWRAQYDPKQRAKARAALDRRNRRRQGLDPSRAMPSHPEGTFGRPKKYTNFGSLLKFTVSRKEKPDVRPVEPASADGPLEPVRAPELDREGLDVRLHQGRATDERSADPSGHRPAVITVRGPIPRRRRPTG